MTRFLLLLLLLWNLCGLAQPANDDPCNATPLSVNTSCIFAAATNAGATATAGVSNPSCAFYNGGDVWFSAIVPANGILSVDTDDGSMTDSGMALYSGSCGSLTQLACDDDNSANGSMSYISLSGLTPGSTIFIRVWEFGNDNNGTFSICASSPMTPDNDEPCNATGLTVESGCNYVFDSNTNATGTSAVPGTPCGWYNGGDIWYTFTVPATGAALIDAQAGTMTDGAMAVYSADACNGTFTLIGCDDDSSPNGSMPQLLVSGQTPGETLYIRFWEFGNDNQGSFGICIRETGPCGFEISNDFCPHPSIIQQGPGTFSSTTDGTFTPDLPGNLGSNFCGTIENNSWYYFTASAATENFPISSVTGCNLGLGIQGVVYDVAHDAQGCCTGFTQVSNCYSPGNTSTGTITAAGLTPGNTYLLMIDGYSNDGCEFTISNWSVITPLGIEITGFKAKNSPAGAAIEWEALEKDASTQFEVQHATDGWNFETLTTIPAAVSEEWQSYAYMHEQPAQGLNYYRLKILTPDGSIEFSDIVSMERNSGKSGLQSLFPNPAGNLISAAFSCSRAGFLSLQVYDRAGIPMLRKVFHVVPGMNRLDLLLDALAPGAYLLECISDAGVERRCFLKTDN